MKKLIAVLLSCLFLASLLTGGCSGGCAVAPGGIVCTLSADVPVYQPRAPLPGWPS